MMMQNRTAKRDSPSWPRFGLRTVLLAAALLGLLQQHAQAQATTKTETTTTNVIFKNVTRCDANKEAVDIYATEKHYTQTQTSAGGVKITDDFDDRGTGTGQVSGAKYRYSFLSENKFRSSTNTFYIRLLFREHLIRQDSTVQQDDWYSLETLLINVTNGQSTFKPESIQADCR
jgi:hypothetical protein